MNGGQGRAKGIQTAEGEANLKRDFGGGKNKGQDKKILIGSIQRSLV